MSNPHEEIRRGNEANEALENEYIKEALQKIEEHYNNAWANSKPAEIEVRENAYRMLLTVGEFRHVLTNVVETGKLAATTRNGRLAQQTR